jgi:transposase
MPEFVRTLGVQEVAAIQKLLRSRSAPAGVYVRALIVHWSSQGQTPSEIAARLDHKFDNVVKWIRRFNAEGLAGLQERPGRGRKRRLQATDALAVVETTLAAPS